ncbi:MAG: TolC family protein [Bacteroidia bacterium]|nr:TolC family protein [Bacteroidia bacterium]
MFNIRFYLYPSLLICFGLNLNLVKAQDSTVLAFDAFYDQVLKYHPMAKAANLLPEMAKAELRSARGAFDPVIQTQVRGKQTNDKNSYQYIEPQIKIPTLPGIDFKAGLDQSSGISVNPEVGKYNELTGGTRDVQYQLFYAGVSVPVLRGLFTDVRRNELRQAQLLQGLNQAEQVSQINKLLLEAAKVYWDWQQSYEQYRLMRENFLLAQNRLNFIVQRILAGEEKPIDSVEAWVEYQRREALLLEQTLVFQNSGLTLSNYLWSDQNQPLQLSPGVIPSSLGSNITLVSTDSIQKLSSNAQTQHPDIQKLSFKVKQSELDRKLALENLKPQLNLEYIPFQTYTAGSRDEVDGLFMKNYKYGITFYSSVFLRKERGKLQLTNYKLQQSQFQLQQGKRDIENRILIAYNQLETARQMIEIQQRLVQNASLLRNAEEMRFESGESSLFLINQRERALLEAQSKLAELSAKYAKAKYQLQWASGTKLF